MIRSDELIVDSFAGGGGASLGMRMALGREPDIAINHDAAALAMHEANHPATHHFQQNIWQVDPVVACGRRPVGLAWFSPDCTHHSKAKGGKPLKKHIRDLAWVVVLWAKRVRPRVICLENVEEFADWGPLGDDGRPIADLKGATFKRWIRELRRLGYKVEHRELRACDYGAPTIRKRLFLIARRDGQPIVWPQPMHGPGLLPYRTAAEIIDWSIPCPSIFLTREEARAVGCKRPLEEATMRRIARGVFRYVIDAAEPFIVPVTHRGDDRVHASSEPLRTITTASRGEFGLVAPYLVPRYGERPGQEPRTYPVDQPAPTVVPTGNGGSLAAVALTKFQQNSIGQDLREPMHTAMAGAPRFGMVAAFLAQHNTGMVGHDARRPLSTIVGRGTQQQLVQAFLLKYYGTASGQRPDEPLHTATTLARFGLVTIAGVDYQIADIGMRMLSPRELFRAQGFPDDWRLDVEIDGRPMTKTAQIRLCGNSVCPDVAAAIVRANLAAVLPADEAAA